MITSYFKEKKEKVRKVYVLKRTPIKKTTQKRGHRFSVQVKREILVRDRGCINPQCQRTDWKDEFHHVYFHRSEKIYDFKEANTVDKGVLLCGECHDGLHHRGDKRLDTYCHEYLHNLYT